MDPLEYRSKVRYWVFRYLAIARARGLDRADLEQVGFLAILKARRTHGRNGHPDKDFPGYVGPWIRTAMHRAVHAPDAETASLSGPAPEDLRWVHIEPDEGVDEAAKILRVLTDRQARAVELHLGLDGTPGRSVDEVADLMGCSSRGNAHRLIKSGLANLKRTLSTSPQPHREG